MDGYTLVEKMRKARRRYMLTISEQALYHELVSICNSEDWREIFHCSNAELCSSLNINEKTLIKARECLIKSGLIFFNSGKSRKAVSSYSFTVNISTTVTTTVNNTVVENKTTVETPVNFTVDSTVVDSTTVQTAVTSTVKFTDNIKTKTKTRKKDIIDLVFPFHSENFLSNWKILSEMPKWKKKIPHSLQLALNSLGKYEEEFAVELIEKAIEGNWQGVTFTNTPDDYQKWLKRNGKNRQISSESEERAFIESVVTGVGRAEFERNNNLQ